MKSKTRVVVKERGQTDTDVLSWMGHCGLWMAFMSMACSVRLAVVCCVDGLLLGMLACCLLLAARFSQLTTHHSPPFTIHHDQLSAAVATHMKQ